MNNYDKELLKTTPSMIKGIAVQAAQLKGNQNASLSFDDVCGMVNFGLALGCQISEADETNTRKVIAECAIGSALIGCFIGLLALILLTGQPKRNASPINISPFNSPCSSTVHYKPRWPSWNRCITFGDNNFSLFFT